MPPRRSATAVQRDKRPLKRLPDTRLLERQPHFLAEWPYDSMGRPEVSSRHRREQVVLDLVVQTTKHKVRDPARQDIARGYHLSLQKGGLRATGPGGHSLVVRRDRQA